MIKEWIEEPRPGLKLGRIIFDNPVLDRHSCPVIEMSGGPGPLLCIMSGIHINEASSIAAAANLADHFDPATLKGTISIIPVVSTHNLFKYTLVTPPSAGRDLHWSYPGSPDGTFNEALAYALLNDWGRNADVLLDLHGGDLDERMTRYVVIQSTEDPAFNARARALASCFDTSLVVELAATGDAEFGRCCTALSAQRKLGLVSEAGDSGTPDAESIQWHTQGILQVAAWLGMIPSTFKGRGDQAYLDRYEWITAPQAGLVERTFEPGEWIESGEVIGIVRDFYGRVISEIRAPASGFVMMQKTTQIASKGYWIGSVAIPRGQD